jgi:hypothetical protein
MKSVEPGWVWDEVSDLDYVHAGRVLRLPVGWLKEMAPAEKIPCTRYGKHVRFTPDDIREIRRMHRVAVAGIPAPTPEPAVADDAYRAEVRRALLRANAA